MQLSIFETLSSCTFVNAGTSNLAATLDVQEIVAGNGGETDFMELLSLFWDLVHFGTYLIMQESLVHNI